MRDEIIEMLKQNSFSARASFSQVPFEINATAPTITVGQTKVVVQKQVVDGEEKANFEREITLNVYTPKVLGEMGAKNTAQKVLALVIPFARALEMGECAYDTALRHYKTTVTLTLYKTEE